MKSSELLERFPRSFHFSRCDLSLLQGAHADRLSAKLNFLRAVPFCVRTGRATPSLETLQPVSLSIIFDLRHRFHAQGSIHVDVQRRGC